MAMEPAALDLGDLGRLAWDEARASYRGTVVVPGGPTLDLGVDPFSDVVPSNRPVVVADPAALAASAVAQVHAVIDRIGELRQHAADELLDDYNDEWNDEAPVDAATLAASFSLDAIEVDQDLFTEVFLSDGGRFAGHAITVSIESDGEPEDVALFG